MANDIVLSSGTGGGATLGTDQNAATSEHFQIVKLQYGALSSYNLVSTALPLPVITASAGLVQVLTSGTLVVQTSGTTTISGTVVSASSGLVQALTSGPLQVLTSGTLVVQTSGTTTVVSASSGRIQSLHLGAVTSSGLSSFHFDSTGGVSVQVVTTSPVSLYSYEFFNSSAGTSAMKIYGSTGPTIGSTVGLLKSVLTPATAGTVLSWPIGVYSSAGLSIVLTANVNGTDTGGPSGFVTADLNYQI